MKRILLLCLMLLCLTFPALADDVCTVDVSSVLGVTCTQSYLRLTCPLPGEVPVTVSVRDGGGTLVYQRDYGMCSDWFSSEDLYLRLSGGETLYQVTVQAGSTAYALSVTRKMGRLTGNEACSVGYPLSRISGGSSWKTVTLLDISSLEGRSMTVPLYASGSYTLGSVTFSVSGGYLTVQAQLSPGIDGSIDQTLIQAATDVLTAQSLGSRRFAGPTGRLGEAIPLHGSAYAAVLVQMTVSFDPSGVPGTPSTTLDGQSHLWQLMQDATANEAVG